jgi:hypothetical protein
LQTIASLNASFKVKARKDGVNSLVTKQPQWLITLSRQTRENAHYSRAVEPLSAGACVRRRSGVDQSALPEIDSMMFNHIHPVGNTIFRADFSAEASTRAGQPACRDYYKGAIFAARITYIRNQKIKIQ